MSNSLRWSPEQLAAHQARRAPVAASIQIAPKPASKYKSKLEAAFAVILDRRKQAGEITSWGYEGIHLRLPGDVMYRLDFFALRSDGVTEAIETKGRMMAVARIKLRQAVERYPGFEWYLVSKDLVPVRMYSPADVPSVTR